MRPNGPEQTPWVPEKEQVSLSILSIKVFSSVAKMTLVSGYISTWMASPGLGFGKTGKGDNL